MLWSLIGFSFCEMCAACDGLPVGEGVVGSHSWSHYLEAAGPLFRALQTGEDAVELVRGLESRMKAAIQDLRTEFMQKLSVITNEITQMQKQINVQKGEQNILAQQNKESNRRVMEISEQVQELSLELLGDPAGAASS